MEFLSLWFVGASVPVDVVLYVKCPIFLCSVFVALDGAKVCMDRDLSVRLWKIVRTTFCSHQVQNEDPSQ